MSLRWITRGARDRARRRSDTGLNGVRMRWQLLWVAGVVTGFACVVLVLLIPTDAASWVTAYGATAGIALIVFLGAALSMPTDVRSIWWTLWAFQALAIAAYGIGEARDRGITAPILEPLEIVLLVSSFVAAFAALALLVGRLQPGRDFEVWIDSAILTVAAASAVTTFIITPAVAVIEPSGSGSLLSVVYPLLDLAVLSVLIWLMVGSRQVNPALALLVVSFVLYLGADLASNATIIRGEAADGPPWFAALRLAAVVSLAAAATAPGAAIIARPRVVSDPRTTPTRMVGLGIGVLTAPTILAYEVYSGADRTLRMLAGASIIVILLALWRMVRLLAAVDRQRRLTELVLDSTGDGIIGLDLEGYVLFANLSARRMLRCREVDLVGKRFHDVAHHEYPDGRTFPWSECPTREVVRTGGSGVMPDISYIRRDGSMFPAEVVVAPIVVDGQATGGVMSFRDVSERHAMDEMKRQFVSIVSHELRTPLTSIRAACNSSMRGSWGR